VLDRAAELFGQRGYNGTNLRDVADALKMSRPALYYHFPNKEKLLEAIVEETTLLIEVEMARMMDDSHEDPEVALHGVMRFITNWILDHHVIFKVLDRVEPEMSPEIIAKNNRAKLAILRHLSSIIDRGIAMGRFRPVDSHIVALTVIGMRNWVAWWYKPDGRLAPEAIAEIIADMAVRSISRTDSYRARSNRVEDALRILKEDVAHLSMVVTDAPPDDDMRTDP
jgi:AcrR family transcriptional regulator